MSGNKETYDLVVSLGGNCAAAHNLRYKNLRTAAYPFDWTYFNSDEAVYKLVDGFKDSFNNYALKENFKELPINPEHPDRIQYEDTYGKIVWANYFRYCENNDEDYAAVKEKLDRRFKRLIDEINKSNKILFIFSTSFQIKPDAFCYLSSCLNEIYPDKDIHIRILSFNCEKDCIYENQNVKLYCYQRKISFQDFSTTDKEWDFLDSIKLSGKFLYNLKRLGIKLLINCVPLKVLRSKLRRKYHV